MPRSIREGDEYQNRLVKLIPTEIVGAYLALNGIIPPQEETGRLVATAILFVLTFLYLRILNKVKSVLQIVVTAISFLVWVYSLQGSIFDLWQLYVPWIASLILIVWTLTIPLFVKPEEPKP